MIDDTLIGIYEPWPFMDQYPNVKRNRKMAEYCLSCQLNLNEYEPMRAANSF